MTDTDTSGRSGRDLEKMATAMTLGFGIALSLALLAGGGIWLDQRLDTVPWFTLAGIALGLIAAAYQLYELVLLSRNDRPNGPIGNALSHRMSKSQRSQRP